MWQKLEMIYLKEVKEAAGGNPVTEQWIQANKEICSPLKHLLEGQGPPGSCHKPRSANAIVLMCSRVLRSQRMKVSSLSCRADTLVSLHCETLYVIVRSLYVIVRHCISL